jgi:hypothetical protein
VIGKRRVGKKLGCYLKHDYDGVRLNCGNLIETWIRALGHVDPFGKNSILLCMHALPYSCHSAPHR